jgi:hypothetical protein
MASSQSDQYRALLWVFTGMGLLCFWPALQGARGKLTPAAGLMSGVAAVICLFAGAYFGWKGAQLRIAEREKKADAVALVMMAAFLKDKTEAELEAAATKGGPVGAAARLLLERRRTGLRPSSAHPTPKT